MAQKVFGYIIVKNISVVLVAANIVALPVLVGLFIMLFDHILTMFGA